MSGWLPHSGKNKPCFSKNKTHRNKDFVKQSLQQDWSFYIEMPPHIEEAIEIIRRLEREKKEK